MRIIAALLVFSTTALAPAVIAGEPKAESQNSESSSEEAKKREEAPEAKKICRRIQDMGSRRTQRVCMTREQWKDYNNAN